MSLRKSPTLTPALLEANRRNAQRSTGPRTARGKAQVRFNALKGGSRSRLYRDLRMALLFAPPGAVLGPGRLLTPEMARHPLFAEAEEIAIEAESDMCMQFSGAHRRPARPRGKQFLDNQSRNVADNKRL
jgi:hypothetical protein